MVRKPRNNIRKVRRPEMKVGQRTFCYAYKCPLILSAVYMCKCKHFFITSSVTEILVSKDQVVGIHRIRW